MSTMICLVLLYIINIYISFGQTCLNGLESPIAVRHDATGSDIEWVEIDYNKYAYTLRYSVSIKQWDGDVNARITTRLHNDMLPSPTLRMKRGKQYHVTLINDLGPESANNPIGHNIIKDPNTTNLHTHGLHIGGEAPGDNVFIALSPGDSHTYIYNIPCDHSGGTFWYHPHHHGSTEAQVNQGCAGALIIEDDKDMEQLPDWYTNMREFIFFVTHMDLGRITDRVNTSFDYLWQWEKLDNNNFKNDIFLVNGEYEPTICADSGEWIKFRFAHVESETPRKYYIGNGECSVYLLARDGVIVHGTDDTDVPRYIADSVVWLAQPSRTDVAIYCPGDPSGSITYPIWINETDRNGPYIITIATIQVTGTQTSPGVELTAFTPNRPHYLENLLDGYYAGYLPTQKYPKPGGFRNYWKGVQVSPNSIGGVAFHGEHEYLAHIGVNTLNTWEVTNLGLHPLHIHINHFQIMEDHLPVGNDTNPIFAKVYPPAGFQEVGDFQDTLWGPGLIRFKTDIWGGTIAMHCHILRHEDDGAMGTVEIVNGCNNNYQPYISDTNESVAGFAFSPECTYVDTCDQFTSSPSTDPTESPTPAPTESTASPSAAPTINTTCEGHTYYDHLFEAVDRFNDRVLATKVDETEDFFIVDHPECRDDTAQMVEDTYLYKYIRKGKAKTLEIFLIVCCGADNVFHPNFTVDGYSDANSMNGVISDDFSEDFAEVIGTKEIIVFVIVSLIIVAALIFGVLYYKKHKIKKFLEQQSDEKNIVVAVDKTQSEETSNTTDSSNDNKAQITDSNKNTSTDNTNNGEVEIVYDNDNKPQQEQESNAAEQKKKEDIKTPLLETDNGVDFNGIYQMATIGIDNELNGSYNPDDIVESVDNNNNKDDDNNNNDNNNNDNNNNNNNNDDIEDVVDVGFQ